MKAQWIWYDGDYELMLLNQSLTQRYERDVFIPPFWRMDYFHTNVKFSYAFTLTEAEDITVLASGKFNIILDDVKNPTGAYVRGFNGVLHVEPGSYHMTVSVYNTQTVPALYVSGKTVFSGKDFSVTCNDFVHVQAGCCGFTDPNEPPTCFRYTYQPIEPVSEQVQGNTVHLDFGRETMAYLQLEGLAEGRAYVYYGESEEESTDRENCEQTDVILLSESSRTPIAKAFRYVTVDFEGTAPQRVRAVREFVPQERVSSFTCENETLNRIYKVSLDTLQLNARDFLLDGIKRDRWVWAGDAVQSDLMMYYSFFDVGVIERTKSALPNREPQATFLNHIMDYSLYWIISLSDYYYYVGDDEFLKKAYAVAKSIMAFTESRKNSQGFLEGRPEDWVFIDWAPLDNRGAVSAEQIIYLKALSTMITLGETLGEDISAYRAEYQRMKAAIDEVFWDEESGSYVYALYQGKKSEQIKRHPNIFAVYYGLIEGARAERIKQDVLKNESVEKITTPYMRFYELSALSELGETDFVMNEILSYWGGMLALGATSFWECFDVTKKGAEHYAMYGRKYGLSLCHAWGASPLYLIGRYLIGLTPACKGYTSFNLRPRRSSVVGDYKASVPMKNGTLEISYGKTELCVLSQGASGTLYLPADTYDLPYPIENGEYKVPICDGERYCIPLISK